MAANKAVASAPHTRPLFPQSCRPPGLIPSCRSGPCPVTQTSAPRQVQCSAPAARRCQPGGEATSRAPCLNGALEAFDGGLPWEASRRQTPCPDTQGSGQGLLGPAHATCAASPAERCTTWGALWVWLHSTGRPHRLHRLHSMHSTGGGRRAGPSNGGCPGAP